MNDKVQLTRTVDLDKIPDFVSQMLGESHELFRETIDAHFKELKVELDENKNYTRFLELLEELRSNLAEADMMLDDSKHIMVGYVNILAGKYDDQKQTQAQKPDTINAELLETIKENMANQVEKMENHGK
jgi:hypothetical protein